MAHDRNREQPRFSRSGRVLKKTFKMKEMEDLEIEDDKQEKPPRRFIHPHLKVKQAECLVHGTVQSSSVGTLNLSLPSDISSFDRSCPKFKSGHQVSSYSQKCLKELHGSNVYLSESNRTEISDTSSEDGSSSSGTAEEIRKYLKVPSDQRVFVKSPKLNCDKYQKLLSLKHKTALKRHTNLNRIIKNSKDASSYYFRKNTKKIDDIKKKLFFCELSKSVGGSCLSLPRREMEVWRGDTKQPSTQHLHNFSKRKHNRTKSVIVTNQLTSQEQQQPLELLESSPVLGTAPIDVAAHLILLGGNLMKIGMTVANLNHIGPGVYSSLLDMLLCSMAPMLCLTKEIAGLETLPEDVFLKILDHVAYIMPGL